MHCAIAERTGLLDIGVSDPAAALERLRQEEFDLLLTDLMMPGMDGIQLLRQASRSIRNLVGIIMTGQGTIPPRWRR